MRGAVLQVINYWIKSM